MINPFGTTQVHIEPGIIWVPFIIINERTTINNELFWHRNKFINFLLKIKHIFLKPKYISRYADKKINNKYYTVIKINEKNESN